jgi:hypothetical protein
VQLMGKATIVPDMKSLEYIFKTPEGKIFVILIQPLTTDPDSKFFQELVFNKDLVLEEPITILKIRSKRNKESDATALRFWKTRNSMPTRKDFSLQYHVNNERPVKEYIEISCKSKLNPIATHQLTLGNSGRHRNPRTRKEETPESKI